jgi:hypothetical protein
MSCSDETIGPKTRRPLMINRLVPPRLEAVEGLFDE